MARKTKTTLAKVAALIVCLAVVAGVIFVMVSLNNNFKNKCEANGGTVTNVTSVPSKNNQNRKVTTACIQKDGTVITF